MLQLKVPVVGEGIQLGGGLEGRQEGDPLHAVEGQEGGDTADGQQQSGLHEGSAKRHIDAVQRVSEGHNHGHHWLV
jgi:hypothetical protein